ncbi:hypothetical protein [Lysinibacillus fusiformis]|uniref:hypothetical protein n=1 Tax=Lysinibacillus fusiformis TaxID=28031 RepID=UPI003D06A055
MVPYVDPIPSVIRFLTVPFAEELHIYGNMFPNTVQLPALLIRQAGGNNSFRLQFISRANDDITAMSNLIMAMNYFEQYGYQMQGIRAEWISRESNPIPSVDTDSGKPEAWCYINVEAMEA